MTILIFFIALIAIAISGFRIIYQYEEAVTFTLGKFSTIKKPGLRWIFPGIQTITKVDTRILTIDVPKQEIITKDNISVSVSAVIYFAIIDPRLAVVKIQNLSYAVEQYVLAALRDAIGNRELDAVLAERVQVSKDLISSIDVEVDKWGIRIDSISIQEIEVPQELKRAMAKQAEAERERRAMIISAEGEKTASQQLSDAASILSSNPSALQLRTLQTIRDISTNPAQKIIMFLPSGVDSSSSIKNMLSGEDVKKIVADYLSSTK